MKKDHVHEICKDDSVLKADMDPKIRDHIDEICKENEALRSLVSDLQRINTELEALADSDTLTPLPNRRRFMRELERVIAHCKRYGEPAALLFVDVDQLKTMNDRHGHATGDSALLHVARQLRSAVREVDCVARLGGDEFGIILEKLDLSEAEQKAARLADHIGAEPVPGHEPELFVSVSIGLTMIDPQLNATQLIARADGAMYEIKAVR